MSCSGYRGTRAFIACNRTLNDLDTSQSQSVYHAARRKCRPAQTDPTVEQWEQLVDQQMLSLCLDESIEPKQFSRLSRYLNSVRSDTPPDAVTFAALQDLGGRSQKAAAALRRQLHSAAAFQGVTAEEASERFAAFRAQYQQDFSRLPAAERPDPPATWVTGYTTKDMMAVSSPADRATLYAMYRCQADPTVYPNATPPSFASIDLETAGPPGRDGFVPVNGSIIEVAIVEYSSDGTHVGTYAQLVKPSESVSAICGTGAVDIHGITPSDVEDSPAWRDVAGEVASRLRGRTMLAQNSPFERDWLTHHMPEAGQNFTRYGPTVDTLLIARQHVPTLPSYKLATICEAVGVSYTDGHRAQHDAEVAAQAFFKLRSRINSDWAASPARANAPHPAPGAGLAAHRNPLRRRGPWVPSPLRRAAQER